MSMHNYQENGDELDNLEEQEESDYDDGNSLL